MTVSGEMCPSVSCVPGDLSHALAVRRAHPDPDSFPQSGFIGRLHGRRLGPLVDGSDRADNFADSGGGDFQGRCHSMAAAQAAWIKSLRKNRLNGRAFPS
jgi:hypothetical protein